MKEFLAHHSYLIIWILALIIIGFAAVFIFQLNGITTGSIQNPSPLIRSIPAVSPPPAPAAAPAPSITLTIVKSPAGNSLAVQWQNLPGNTTALNIFRGKNNATSSWSLWKTLDISAGDLADGNANIDLGSSLDNGYSFYVEAVEGNGNGNNNSTSTNGDQTILWTSSSTTPIVATSTPPSGPDNGNVPPPDNNPPSTPSSTPSSTPQNPTPSSTPPDQTGSSPSSSNPSSGSGDSGNNPSGPQGDPYYNPEVQITGYGTAPGSFWVEHVNQSIEIGWQNLPAGITSIVVARSESSDGPWGTIIAQQNPGTSGSYSLQLIDNTINDPYYYEMTAFNGTTTIATYGPVYLAGN